MLCFLLSNGCQSNDPLSAKNDPKSPWWELGFTEPNYLKVWVEDSAVRYKGQDVSTHGRLNSIGRVKSLKKMDLLLRNLFGLHHIFSRYRGGVKMVPDPIDVLVSSLTILTCLMSSGHLHS